MSWASRSFSATADNLVFISAAFKMGVQVPPLQREN